MPRKDPIEVVPAITAICGSTSELRYRLLMAALASLGEVVTPPESAAAKPSPTGRNPKRSAA
jgi:hypothetical protein